MSIAFCKLNNHFVTEGVAFGTFEGVAFGTIEGVAFGTIKGISFGTIEGISFEDKPKWSLTQQLVTFWASYPEFDNCTKVCAASIELSAVEETNGLDRVWF